MINYSNWDDGSLTAAYGAYQRQRQDQSQFYNNMRADILAECLKLIDQRINIQMIYRHSVNNPLSMTENTEKDDKHGKEALLYGVCVSKWRIVSPPVFRG